MQGFFHVWYFQISSIVYVAHQKQLMLIDEVCLNWTKL